MDQAPAAKPLSKPSPLPKPPRKTEVIITLQQFNPGRGRHTSARVLSFDTNLPPKDCLATLQAIATLLANYRKDTPSV